MPGDLIVLLLIHLRDLWALGHQWVLVKTSYLLTFSPESLLPMCKMKPPPAPTNPKVSPIQVLTLLRIWDQMKSGVKFRMAWPQIRWKPLKPIKQYALWCFKSHCQLDWVWNHLTDTRFGYGGKTYNDCKQHHPVDWYLKLHKRRAWPRCHHSPLSTSGLWMLCDQLPHAPTALPSPSWWTVSPGTVNQKKSFLPKLFLVTTVRKVTNIPRLCQLY